jgi:hypothetical protein
MNQKIGWILLLAFTCAANLAPAASPGVEGSKDKRSPTITISVGPDQDLNYPSSLITLPDEHTTFIPPDHGSNKYLVFAASTVNEGTTAGTVALETSDLVNFDFAEGYNNPVMSPPVLFGKCDPAYDTEFDENYSAPGSVLPDPDTAQNGTMLMFYEAENHCPGDVNQTAFYATVGFARSQDFGKTWPAPIDSEFGGTDRYPVLKVPAPEPTIAETNPTNWGDAIPSAFVEKNYVYVSYTYWAGPKGDGDPPNDFIIHVAQAQLNNNGEPLSFLKWSNGSFSTPGIGGVVNSPLPSNACPGYETDSSISRIDQLGIYLMVYLCTEFRSGPIHPTPVHAGWYYSTASSLELEDWTAPKLIQGSFFPVVYPCGVGGNSFDGYYPSFMSPGKAPGHLAETGLVFYLDGCDLGRDRKFKSRTFTITVVNQ